MQSPSPLPEQNTWHDRLARKWELKSKWDFWWIFFGFAVTGSLTSFITTRAIVFLHGEQWSWMALLAAKIILLLLVYPFVLLAVGMVIGQYGFFSKFLGRMFRKRR